MRRFTRITGALLALVLVFSLLSGCGGTAPDSPSYTAAPTTDAAPVSGAVPAAEEAAAPEEPDDPELPDESSPAALSEDGEYTSAEDVALYLHLYGRLPENFITKKDARALGWNGGGLDSYADGKCIGGDRFGNYEGLLPEAPGREYHECDIDTLHASSRGAKRIVYSNDGLIYYTEDHYESFVLLYGEE